MRAAQCPAPVLLGPVLVHVHLTPMLSPPRPLPGFMFKLCALRWQGVSELDYDGLVIGLSTSLAAFLGILVGCCLLCVVAGARRRRRQYHEDAEGLGGAALAGPGAPSV